MCMPSSPNSWEEACGYKLLFDSIPGGMFSCLNDESLTLLRMNEGILSMLGYTRQEIRDKFHNSFWALIDPRDRERAKREVDEQLAKSPEKEIEYRMLCQDGRSIWVLDKGRLIAEADGTPSFSCLLVDITRSKALESQLRLSLDRHKIIMDQAEDIIFEWDILADTFYFSSNWEKKFGYTPLSRRVRDLLATLSHIQEDDRPAFTAMLERIRQGTQYGEVEIRVMKSCYISIWCKVRLTGQQDESGQVVKAVGVFIDVDEEKRRSTRLLESAQRDALTKLYNKGTAQELITLGLESRPPEGCSALFILDLDNFKSVNDTMGHLFGDALLVETAHTIGLQFAPEDVVGRVGGDEFIVYVPQAAERADLEEKAARLIRAISGLHLQELEEGQLSCSVGVACCPACGSDFRTLFQSADEALYCAKKLGKNRYEFRDFQDSAQLMSGQSVSAVNTRIDSEEELKQVGGQFTEYIFQILYHSVDIESAVNSIFEIVGRYFDVSRMYIFENSEDNLYCDNTFEWCNDGVVPQQENLQHLSYEYLEEFQTYFNEEGIFYCPNIQVLPQNYRNILEPQDIRSILQCSLTSGGIFRGYVGFDECRRIRYWTREQVDTLAFISKVLGTFLLKERAQRKAEENSRSMAAILNSRGSWIYVINPDTHETLYLNQKTQELAPDSLGKKCHEAFMGQDQPCSFCPVRSLGTQCDSVSHEIYNPIFDVWTSTEVSYIHWNGKRAALVICHDITYLKRKLDAESGS